MFVEDHTRPPVGPGRRLVLLRRVYGIVAAQVTCTMLVTAAVYFVGGRARDVLSNVAVVFSLLVAIVAGVFVMFVARRSAPANVVLLALWTGSVSCLVAGAASALSAQSVLLAACLASGATLGLVAYSFMQTEEGFEFRCFAPLLLSWLCASLAFGVFEVMIGVDRSASSVYAVFWMGGFSTFIVFDTFRLLSLFNDTDYVWAAMSLYVDMLGVFLVATKIVRTRRKGGPKLVSLQEADGLP